MARLTVDSLVRRAEAATMELQGVRDDAATLKLYARQAGQKRLEHELNQIMLTFHIAQSEAGAGWARTKRMKGNDNGIQNQ